MIYTEKTDELIPAMFHARVAMSSKATRNTANKHLGNKYANLESFLDAIRPALEANNLMIQQGWIEGQSENFIYLKTEVIHISGQSVHFISPFPITKKDAHGVGSAITYARRYAIASIFGIAQADDDGNATRKTSTDVVKALKAAESLDEAEKIYRAAMDPRYFGNDKAAARVISAAYNDRKATLIKPGDGFKPAQFNPQPEAQAQPEQAPEPESSQPGDFSDF